MNIAEAIAFCALVIGLISGAGIWLDAYKRRLTNRERELELQARAAEARSRTGDADVTKLESRLRVLERIATDRGQDLAMQIEGLRHDIDSREKV
ncbi:hypothetical protein [Pelagerythrobacter aerophilus]|uniref:Uncharacterized protein n=1 Tax=Pelagerythrobacter aerophilus TaxID=2306995 RepID=A0A418NDV4_9SPHN|nr:hypothetical protein [Pelagerythrobacter aerophilus]RIV75424.1 hypothetical protein D2V04_14010 [Pelagerythrobacter aerophilus]